MHRFTPFLALLFFLNGFGQQSSFTSTQFASLKWLQGAWKGMAGKEPFYEAWRWVNDSTLVNFSIEVKNGDTSVQESNALLLRGGRIVLGIQPAQWIANRLVPNEIVLKNDSLRYSNTILWLHTTDDHWFTILQNPKSTIYYDMTRDPALDRKVDAWLSARRKKQH